MAQDTTSPLGRAVESKDWDTVLDLLWNNTESTTETRNQAVDVFVHEAPSGANSWGTKLWRYIDIIPHCNSDQVGAVMLKALEEERWDTVLHLLTTCTKYAPEIRSKAVDVFVHTAPRGEGDRFYGQWQYSDVIPHCNSAQLDTALTRALSEKWWDSVLWLLRDSSAYSVEKHNQAVDTFVREAPTEKAHETSLMVRVFYYLNNDRMNSSRTCHSSTGEQWKYHDIIPHCDSNQLDAVLTRLGTEKGWDTVLHVVNNSQGYSAQVRKEAVDVFLRDAPRDFEDKWELPWMYRQQDDKRWQYHDIIPHCDSDQLYTALIRALSEGWWDTVLKLLKISMNNSAEKYRTINVFLREAHGRGESSWYREVIPHCDSAQLNIALTRALREKWWYTVLQLLKNSMNNTANAETRSQAVDVFVQKASNGEERSYGQWHYLDIIPHCNSDQLETVLTRTLTEGWWYTVLKLLKNNTRYSTKKLSQAVDVFVQKASYEEERSYGQWRYLDIIPYCNSDQLDKALIRALSEGWWNTVLQLLKNSMNNTAEKYRAIDVFVREAHSREESLWYRKIIPHCDSALLDKALTRALREKLWHAVLQLLKNSMNNTAEKHRAIDVFVREAPSSGKSWWYHEIIPYCDSALLAVTLTRTLKEGWWETVSKVLERGVGDTQHRHAVVIASKIADDEDFESHILPLCSDDDLDVVLTHLVTRGLWKSLHNIVQRDQSVSESKMITRKLEKTVLALQCLVKYRKWDSARNVVCDGTANAIYHWMSTMEYKTSAKNENTDEDFWQIMIGCRFPASLAQALCTQLTQDIETQTKNLRKFFPFATDHDMEALFRSVLFILCSVMCGGLTQNLQCVDGRLLAEIHKTYFADIELTLHNQRPCTGLFSQGKNLLITLTVCPFPLNLPSAVKSVVLQHLVRHQKWDVIGLVTGLSGVWEHVRRDLIQQAVEQRQWSIVEQWADHTMFNNQRWWVIQEAYKHKQWQVMLLLADHGLTETELMWVRYRVAMYADWDVVLQMFERGVDVTEVREVVESNMASRKTVRDPAKHKALKQRWKQLLEAEKKLTDVLYRESQENVTTTDPGSEYALTRRRAKLKALKAAKSGKWCLVFFYFHRHFSNHCLQEALHMAVESETWHVVIHLVRLLRMDTTHWDSFFSEMFRRRQWAVCRALLDQGLSVQLCLNVLPQLMEMDQWMLVAKVMEFNVGDAVRRQILQSAMERREGSVVWRCISTMQQYRLSVDERKELFQQAFSRGIWQAIKPLVEEKDSIGIQHRDLALLAAIEHHQWDVVDYCQHYHADINMKDDQGETPLNRAAKKKDWKAVEELVVRGADPNLLEKKNFSVMIRVIYDQQWETTRLLITCLADIHQHSRYQRSKARVTPLQLLIQERQDEIIHHSLLWCPDQSQGVTGLGETTLHAMAVGERPDLLYYQVVRGVNPLTVTEHGQSVMMYAVQNSHCPQRMVAECIRLGFSTHQPQLTNWMMGDVVEVILKSVIQHNQRGLITSIRSPFLLSVLKGLGVLAQMLFESGSCSYTEVHYLHCHLLAVTDVGTKDGERLQVRARSRTNSYTSLTENVKKFLPYLKKMVTTPRSLKSLCRLVISHRLNVHRRYHRDVQQLPELDDEMRKYLMFSDLTNPDYSYVTTPRSLASSCRLVIFARLFFCTRGLMAGEGKNSVPSSLDDILDSVCRKLNAEEEGQ